ncbi:septal ring lytic transglycosylase RlpA family protein [Novosphingobium colocasiae]|nr:septal ring lytic transglycosylase RlpA family protein [Novosphingobium colocasiae]
MFLIASPLHADSALVRVAVSPTAPAATLSPAPVLSPVPATAVPAPPPAPVYQPMGKGIASYYGRELIGARTASGERYDPGALTAAHRSLPMGSHVQVTNAATGQSVIVTINDRGPFHGNRVIDLSQAAARQLGIERAGSGMVSLAVEADD